MAMAVVRAAAVDGDSDGCLWHRFASSPSSSSFVADCCVAHATLVERGTTLADRLEVARSLLGENGYTITRCRCGPMWQILRRNLVAETLHPSRVRLAGRPREDTTDQQQLVFPGNNCRAEQDTSRRKISSVIIFF
ncbi:hypothetical protein DAI22_06g051400 [Oryza sativa Japonica Group]|jgi:hypothetical protein|uniref:Uncharacterized protein n=1 Tax=Oryza sativa subsp. japonica TaxID=39947 RepID=Q5SND0_ORYSJ|nr:hypothetical protein DAI22_06g051400 [Oryza sativa Japonica Group]BAD72276.1 hypothetical protein [Oryza sativa Japonica Group]